MKQKLIFFIILLDALFPSAVRNAYSTSHFSSEEDCLDQLLNDPKLFYAILSIYDESHCGPDAKIDADSIFSRAKVVRDNQDQMAQAMEKANRRISMGFANRVTHSVHLSLKQKILNIDNAFETKILDNGVGEITSDQKKKSLDRDEDLSHLNKSQVKISNLVETKISKENVTMIKQKIDTDEDVLQSKNDKKTHKNKIKDNMKATALGPVNEVVFKPVEFRLDGGFNAQFEFGGNNAFKLDTNRPSIDDETDLGFKNISNIQHNIIHKDNKLGDVDIQNVIEPKIESKTPSNIKSQNSSPEQRKSERSDGKNEIKPINPGFNFDLPNVNPNGLKSNQSDDSQSEFGFKKPKIRNEIIKKDNELGSVDIQNSSNSSEIKNKSSQSKTPKKSSKKSESSKNDSVPVDNNSTPKINNKSGVTSKKTTPKIDQNLSNETKSRGVVSPKNDSTPNKSILSHPKTEKTSNHSATPKIDNKSPQKNISQLKSEKTQEVDQESSSSQSKNFPTNKNPSFKINIDPFKPNTELKTPKSDSESQNSSMSFKKPKIEHEIVSRSNQTNEVDIIQSSEKNKSHIDNESETSSVSSPSSSNKSSRTDKIQNPKSKSSKNNSDDSSSISVQEFSTPKTSEKTPSKISSPTPKNPEKSSKVTEKNSNESSSISVHSFESDNTPKPNKKSSKNNSSIQIEERESTPSQNSSIKTPSKSEKIPSTRYSDIEVSNKSHETASSSSPSKNHTIINPDISWKPGSQKLIDLKSNSQSTDSKDLSSPGKKPNAVITVIDKKDNPSKVSVDRSEVTGKKKKDSQAQTSTLTSDHDRESSPQNSEILSIKSLKTPSKSNRSSSSIEVIESVDSSKKQNSVELKSPSNEERTSKRSIHTPINVNPTDSDISSISHNKTDHGRSSENPTSVVADDISEGSRIQKVRDDSYTNKLGSKSNYDSSSNESQPDSYKDKEDRPIPSSDYHSTTKKKNKYFAGKTIFVLQFAQQGRRLSGKTMDRKEMREEIIRLMSLLPPCIRMALMSCVPDDSSIISGCQNWRGRDCVSNGLSGWIKCGEDEDYIAGSCYKKCPSDMDDKMLSCHKRKIEMRSTKKIDDNEISKFCFFNKIY